MERWAKSIVVLPRPFQVNFFLGTSGHVLHQVLKSIMERTIPECQSCLPPRSLGVYLISLVQGSIPTLPLFILISKSNVGLDDVCSDLPKT